MEETPWKEVLIPKKSGGHRKICIPSPQLKKELVKQNHELTKASAILCPHAHAFVPGRSAVTAAMKHRGFAYTLSCDLVEFFDNVPTIYRRDLSRLYEADYVTLYRPQGQRRSPVVQSQGRAYFNPPIGPPLQFNHATISSIYAICRHARMALSTAWKLAEGRTPQGFPTSPAMANLLSARMDALIVQELHHHDPQAVYTRYADDLTISSNSREAIDEMRKRLPQLVGVFGHTCHPDKWRLQTAAFGKRIVCGVAIGGKKEPLTATRTARRRLRAMQHQVDTGKRTSRKYQKRVRGLREWCQMRTPLAVTAHRRWSQFYDQLLVLYPALSDYVTEPLRNWLAHGWDQPYVSTIQLIARHRPRWRSRYLQSPQQFRYALRLATYLRSLPQDAQLPMYDVVEYTVQGAAVFGENATAYVRRCLAAGITPHDSLSCLPLTITPMDGLGRWILDRTKTSPERFATTQGQADLRAIAQHWLTLGPEDRNLPTNDLLTLVRTRRYQDVRLPEFAAAAAKADIPVSKYNKQERRWIRRMRELTHECIPRGVVSDAAGYRTEFLPRDNPETAYAGAYVNCCQYPGGAAGSSAWHGATHPEGAILAVYHNQKMVAQSWVWRSGSTIVFDNCEAIKKHYPGVVQQYELAAQWLLGKLGIKEVRIGGGNDIEVSQWSNTTPIPPPEKCYSDAKKRQYVIARLATQ